MAAIAFMLSAAMATAVIGNDMAAAATAAPHIPSSELPGRERERFIDPPGAKLLQPNQRSTVLPYEVRSFELRCRPRAGRHKARRMSRC